MRILHNKTALIKAVERLANKGSFAVTIGELALIADDRNLERLVTAFPEYFEEGRANLRIVCSTPQLSISRITRMGM